jgi:hypothetical protein
MGWIIIRTVASYDDFPCRREIIIAHRPPVQHLRLPEGIGTVIGAEAERSEVTFASFSIPFFHPSIHHGYRDNTIMCHLWCRTTRRSIPSPAHSRKGCEKLPRNAAVCKYSPFRFHIYTNAINNSAPRWRRRDNHL